MKKFWEMIGYFNWVSSGGWGDHKRLSGRGKIITMFVMITLAYGFIAILPSIAEAVAASKPNWRAKMTGTIIDVDPIAMNGNSGLFFELENTKGGYTWLWVWGDDVTGSWPMRGDVGTWYTRRIDGDNKYKWEEAKTTSTKKEPEKAAYVRTIPNSTGWESIVRGLPPRDKTVLVRYKNGTTITTAYVNNKKQWKLETDRDRITGGREIATIKEWRDIPE